MKKRIFIAIPPSEELQRKVGTWQKEFKKRVDLPVQWVSPDHLHITLIPPWQVSDRELGSVKRFLVQLTNSAISFDVEFQKVQFGPHPQQPRLIWAKGPTPESATEIKNELERVFENADMGFHAERRPLTFHMTLARFRPETFRSFPIQALNERVRWYSKVSSLVVMQSILSFQGTEYKTLQEYHLKGA